MFNQPMTSSAVALLYFHTSAAIVIYSVISVINAKLKVTNLICFIFHQDPFSLGSLAVSTLQLHYFILKGDFQIKKKRERNGQNCIFLIRASEPTCSTSCHALMKVTLKLKPKVMGAFNMLKSQYLVWSRSDK